LGGLRWGASALRAFRVFFVVETGAFDPGKGCASPSGLRQGEVVAIANSPWSQAKNADLDDRLFRGFRIFRGSDPSRFHYWEVAMSA
jgi:hypothetical protein